jgi:hypothetical protein
MSRRRSFARGPEAFRRGKPDFPSSGKAFLIVSSSWHDLVFILYARERRTLLSVVNYQLSIARHEHIEMPSPLRARRAGLVVDFL